MKLHGEKRGLYKFKVSVVPVLWLLFFNILGSISGASPLAVLLVSHQNVVTNGN